MRGVCTQLSADVTEVIAVPGQCDGVTGRGEKMLSIRGPHRWTSQVSLGCVNEQV